MDVGNRNQLAACGGRFAARRSWTFCGDEFSLEPQAGAAADTERRFRCARTGAEFGFINSVTAPFCRDCNRLRLSADGRLFTCLFAKTGHDLRGLLRGGADAGEIARAIGSVWRRRDDRYSELRATAAPAEPKVEMSYIGG